VKVHPENCQERQKNEGQVGALLEETCEHRDKQGREQIGKICAGRKISGGSPYTRASARILAGKGPPERW